MVMVFERLSTVCTELVSPSSESSPSAITGVH